MGVPQRVEHSLVGALELSGSLSDVRNTGVSAGAPPAKRMVFGDLNCSPRRMPVARPGTAIGYTARPRSFCRAALISSSRYEFTKLFFAARQNCCCPVTKCKYC
jgi:hypothetical protein